MAFVFLASLAQVAFPQVPVLPQGFQAVIRPSPEGTIVYDLSWPAAGPYWGLTKAWLIAPSGAQKAPAVLYMHMYGSGATRDEFYSEALTRSGNGSAALLMSGSVPWKESWGGDDKDAARLQKQIDDVLIGLKLLTNQPWIDSHRIAFVGHDYGAMIGAALAEKEVGFCTFALLAPAPRYSDWVKFFSGPKGMTLEEYDKSFGENSPIVALSTDIKVPILVQFASVDRFISLDRVKDFIARVAQNVTVETVQNASHETIREKGQVSRLKFIDENLGAP